MNNENKELDRQKPYRMCCPQLMLQPERFATLETANRAMDDARNNEFQAILSLINPATGRSKIIGYTPPKKVRHGGA